MTITPQLERASATFPGCKVHVRIENTIQDGKAKLLWLVKVNSGFHGLGASFSEALRNAKAKFEKRKAAK